MSFFSYKSFNICLFSKIFHINKYFEYNPLKIKLLNVFHKYTGYLNVKIIAKSLSYLANTMRERRYNKFLTYILFILVNKNIRKKYKNLNLKFKFSRRLVKKDQIVNKIYNLFHNTINFIDFTREFPFYFLKPFKNFLSIIFNLIKLQNYDILYRYQLVTDCFLFILKYYDDHFFRAFKFYKIFLTNIYKLDILNTYGIRLIVKGRFGKVRKQIQKLVVGSLQLNTFLKEVIYFKRVIITRRGTYGFHIWYSEKV